MERTNPTEIAIWQLLKKDPERWHTHADLARQLPDYGERVIRARAKRLADLGVLERAYLDAANYRVQREPTPEATRHIEALEFGATVMQSKQTKRSR